ncbi:MAG: PEP/pyruvate-binding domain-containing protein [Acidimicrobiales bacterium]
MRPDEPIPDGLGGKGHSLAQLVAAGFPVPTTGVVTTAAYRRVADDADLRRLVARIITGDEVPAGRVDDAFAAAPLPPGLEAEIVELAATVGGSGPVAVRSSATVEDLHGSSFAGQYRSLLDVDSDDPVAVMRAVRLVWASLWHPAPAAYRRAFAIDESDVAMAVVIMAMVPATSAGVVFTVDPAGSAGARVEAVEGLGESLVSGQRTPAAWVVPNDDDGRVLPPAAAGALRLARRVATSFGTPQDVEWAAVDDDVHVVQARPITVLDDDDGFDTPLDDHELTTGGIVEMVPGVLPPLRWELNRFLLEEAFRSVLDSLGIIRGLAAEDRPFVRRVRGRAAIDFDQLRLAARDVPGAVEELEHQYFGTDSTTGSTSSPRPVRRGRLAAIGRDLRTLRTRHHVIDQAEVTVLVTAALRRRRPVLDTRSDTELLTYARRLVDLAGRGLAAELGVAAAAAASYHRLEVMLTSHLGTDEAARWAQDVTSGSGRIAVSRDPSASAAVFAGPTWDERGVRPPDPPATVDDPAERVAGLGRRLRALPGWTRRRILTGQVVDVRFHLIRRSIADTVEQLGRREATKAAVLELGGEVRRVHGELGRRLVSRGVLDEPSDVELLSSAELVAAVGGERPVGPDALRRRRSWIGRYEAEGSLPVRFVGVPDREPEPLPEGDLLEGWGASRGRVTARARVIRSPDGEVARGEVVVAEATDASWSPLFVRAGGVVVERGGPLSHAAILARELGLPCVMNVRGATGRLDGRLVSVDGDRGVVVIVDEEQGP